MIPLKGKSKFNLIMNYKCETIFDTLCYETTTRLFGPCKLKHTHKHFNLRNLQKVKQSPQLGPVPAASKIKS